MRINSSSLKVFGNVVHNLGHEFKIIFISLQIVLFEKCHHKKAHICRVVYDRVDKTGISPLHEENLYIRTF